MGCMTSGNTIHLSFLIGSLPDRAQMIMERNKVNTIVPEMMVVGAQNYTATLEDRKFL